MVKAFVEFFLDFVSVEMLPDYDNLYHAVSVRFFPVASKVGVRYEHVFKLVGRHGGIPLAGFLDSFLLAGLFKEVRHRCVVAEIADAFRADYAFGPSGCKGIETLEIERVAAVVDHCADAVFLGLAMLVVVVMVVTVAHPVLVVAMLMFMLVLMFMFMMMVMVTFLVIFVVVLVGRFLDFMNPCSRSSHFVEIKHPCVDDARQIHVGIICFDYFSARLDGADDALDAFKLVRQHFVRLVQQDDVAELNLLDNEVFDIFVVDVVACQRLTAAKLVAQAQGINYRDNAVELRHGKIVAVVTACQFAPGSRLGYDGGYRAYGPGNRFRLADAAGFDDDVVKPFHGHKVFDLFYKVHFERAADTAVL